MKSEIDRDQLLEMAQNLPPSPRDSKIKRLGIASLVVYFVAGFCAWQFGSLWGLGLVVSLFVIDTLNDFVREEHRQELIEMYDKLVRNIAENSDILEKAISTKSG